MTTQTIISVVAFLVFLVSLPLGIRWFQRRSQGPASAAPVAAKIVSALAVGAHQKVVTIEVGPEGSRSWLVLGVTTQGISCLHTVAVNRPASTQTSSVSAQASS